MTLQDKLPNRRPGYKPYRPRDVNPPMLYNNCWFRPCCFTLFHMLHELRNPELKLCCSVGFLNQSHLGRSPLHLIISLIWIIIGLSPKISFNITLPCLPFCQVDTFQDILPKLSWLLTTQTMYFPDYFISLHSKIYCFCIFFKSNYVFALITNNCQTTGGNIFSRQRSFVWKYLKIAGKMKLHSYFW